MRPRHSARSHLGWTLLLAWSVAHPPAAPAQGPSPPAPGPPPSGQPDPRVLADQVRQLVEMNRKLSDQLGDLSKKYDDLNRKVEKSSGSSNPSASGGGTETPEGPNRRSGSRDVSGPGAPRAVRPSSVTAAAGGGSGGGVRNQDRAQGVGNRRLGKVKLNTAYDYGRDGFLFESEDSEFQLKIRTLFQADAHIFGRPDQSPVSSGLYLPRSRWYFSGRMTRPIEYQVSIQRGYDGIDLLNAYINYNYDRRIQFRVGRYKTPYTYEFYKIPAEDLLAPERSIFNVNFSGNRQVGAMAWGELAENRVEYAVGFFDGARNSYQAFHNGGDVVAFLNVKPFDQSEGPFKNLNVGASVVAGYENNPLTPAVLRTSSQASSAAITSTGGTNTGNIPFLAFNGNVRERGAREQWEVHAAYFYRGLSLLGAYDSGYNSFATTSAGALPVAVPLGGYFVQAAYLVTGETRNNNGLIDPLHPFDLSPERFGLGAIEPTARFSQVSLGRQVFNAGFADPNLWTSSVYQTDIGVNWYLTKYAKIYLDWERSVFGQPVYYRPGPGLQKSSDLYWLRFQLYF